MNSNESKYIDLLLQHGKIVYNTSLIRHMLHSCDKALFYFIFCLGFSVIMFKSEIEIVS